MVKCSPTIAVHISYTHFVSNDEYFCLGTETEVTAINGAHYGLNKGREARQVEHTAHGLVRQNVIFSLHKNEEEKD